ncbi:MAG: hypothetical protein J7M26_05855, partial [Armatimonadetes bacterium]|nr:hypothetical protein [Armatimonadota bacterium]
SYESVKEIYGLLEQRLEPFVLTAEDEPVVWVTGQDLDGILGGHDTSRHVEIERALYNLGLSFRALNSDDLLRLPAIKPPKVILCDDVLRNDLAAVGGHGAGDDAGAAVEEYVRQGGQVLYVAQKPFSALCSELRIGPELAKLAASEEKPVRLTLTLGKGRLVYARGDKLTASQARELVVEFLASELPVRPITVARVTPARASRNLFWRVLHSGDEKMVWLLNMGDGPLDVTLRTRGQQLHLVASDGARLEPSGATSARVVGLNCYALLEW